jgi:hypothetical protein
MTSLKVWVRSVWETLIPRLPSIYKLQCTLRNMLVTIFSVSNAPSHAQLNFLVAMYSGKSVGFHIQCIPRTVDVLILIVINVSATPLNNIESSKHIGFLRTYISQQAFYVLV